MSQIQTHHIHVKGMSCQHCVKAVTQALQAIDPAAKVQVDLGAGEVQVETTLSREAATQAITEEGYEATV
jgi:copper chaperone